MREPLVGAQHERVIRRRAVAEVGPLGLKPRVWPRRQVEKARMRRIRNRPWEVLVRFAEKTVAEDALVTGAEDETISKLPADGQRGLTEFWVLGGGRNGTNSPELARRKKSL